MASKCQGANFSFAQCERGSFYDNAECRGANFSEAHYEGVVDFSAMHLYANWAKPWLVKHHCQGAEFYEARSPRG